MDTNAKTDWLSGDPSHWPGKEIRNKKTGVVYTIGHVFQGGTVEIQRESKTFSMDVQTIREHYEAWMKATVYNAKKVAIAQIDGVEIIDTEAGQMVKFIVPGRLDIGDGYILFLEEGRRVNFATWDTTPNTTTKQSVFCVPMNKVR